MAGQHEQQLRQLLQEVRVLSEQMSQQNQSNVNAQVSHVFGPSQEVRVLSEQMCQGNQSNVINAEVSRVFGRSQGNPSSSLNQNASSSHFRRLTNMRRIGTSNMRNRRNKSRSKAIENTPFLCDLVLLAGPTASAVPRQGKRVALTEHGHVLSACKFSKAMSEVQVETTIMEAFGGKIPPLVDIEILMSVHNKLVKPTLAPGQQGITGIILHRLFKNKPVYVRPNKLLLPGVSQVRLEVTCFDFLGQDCAPLCA